MRCGTRAIVHTFHGHVLQHYFSALRYEAFAAADRALARRTDALLAVSGQVRDDLLALGIGDERRWRVVPVGLDLEPLIRDRTPAPDARTRLGLPVDASLVVSAGRLTAIKDLGTLVRAVARLATTHPAVHLAIAGDGELRASLEEEAHRILPGRVTFLGWCSELPSLYRSADVVASTSTMEGTPLSLIEASAAARPVVATDVGGVADVVVDGVSGRLVARGDDEAVAVAIGRVLDDPDAAAAMGEAGAAWVGPRYSRERLAGDLACLYEELLDRSSLPSPTRSP
jgi:glycosyltransferase involved in cell wall biosynthesis